MKPFETESQQLIEKLPNLQKVSDEIGPKAGEILQKALSNDTATRYSAATELLSAVEGARQGYLASVQQGPLPSKPTLPAKPSIPNRINDVLQKMLLAFRSIPWRKIPWKLLGMVSLVVVIVILMLIQQMVTHDPNSSPTKSSITPKKAALTATPTIKVFILPKDATATFILTAQKASVAPDIASTTAAPLTQIVIQTVNSAMTETYTTIPTLNNGYVKSTTQPSESSKENSTPTPTATKTSTVLVTAPKTPVTPITPTTPVVPTTPVTPITPTTPVVPTTPVTPITPTTPVVPTTPVTPITPTTPVPTTPTPKHTDKPTKTPKP